MDILPQIVIDILSGLQDAVGAGPVLPILSYSDLNQAVREVVKRHDKYCQWFGPPIPSECTFRRNWYVRTRSSPRLLVTSFIFKWTYYDRALLMDFSLKVKYPPASEKKDGVVLTVLVSYNREVWFPVRKCSHQRSKYFVVSLAFLCWFSRIGVRGSASNVGTQ